MDIALITDRAQHEVMSAVAQRLNRVHQFRIVDSTDLGDLRRTIDAELRHPADLYLLRSHVAEVVAMIQKLELAGARVVNPCQPTALCGDRIALDEVLAASGLPLPRTWCAADLKDVAEGSTGMAVPFPLVVKSRWSSRGDVVRKVSSRSALLDLADERPGESVIAQEFIDGDEVDRKVYVIDDLVLAVICPSPLATGTRGERRSVHVDPEWTRLATEVGRVLRLRVFGVDLVLSERGPMVVDVNAFPGFRGVPQAPGALVRMIEATLSASRIAS